MPKTDNFKAFFLSAAKNKKIRVKSCQKAKFIELQPHHYPEKSEYLTTFFYIFLTLFCSCFPRQKQKTRRRLFVNFAIGTLYLPNLFSKFT